MLTSAGLHACSSLSTVVPGHSHPGPGCTPARTAWPAFHPLAGTASKRLLPSFANKMQILIWVHVLETLTKLCREQRPPFPLFPPPG